MKFKRNLGLTDRVLRSGIGLVMMYAGFWSQELVADHLARLALGSMGVFMIGIAIIGYCPMYGMIGFSTLTQKPEGAA